MLNNTTTKPFGQRVLRAIGGILVAVVLFRLSGCSLDQELFCYTGYSLEYEQSRPTFNFLTLTALEDAEQECSERSFQSCIAKIKDTCRAYKQGKDVVFTMANTGTAAPRDLVEKRMAQCPEIVAYDPRIEGVNEDNRDSWWVSSCSMFGEYDQCLDKKGFEVIASTHLRCKALNIIR